MGDAHIMSVLGQHARSLPEHVIVAFFNVRAGTSCESDAVPLGVHGLIYWDSGFELMVRAIKALLSGDVWIPRRILMNAAVQSHSSPQHSTTENGAGILTRRETEILALICVGKSNDEIGEQLFISTNTVKTHIYNIYRKIGVPNRMQAVLWGAKHL
jgi:DNA-binding NarL/FixJ family response regulator